MYYNITHKRVCSDNLLMYNNPLKVLKTVKMDLRRIRNQKNYKKFKTKLFRNRY